MALFGILGSTHSNAPPPHQHAAREESTSDGENMAESKQFLLHNVAIYRRQLKIVVHRLVDYGMNVSMLRGHCLYVRGWWRLSRGYLSKALVDWRAILTTSCSSKNSSSSSSSSSVTLVARVNLLIKRLGSISSSALSLSKGVPYPRDQLLVDVGLLSNIDLVLTELLQICGYVPVDE